MSEKVWEIVEERLSENTSVVHGVGHVKRVTEASRWFAGKLGGTKEEIEDAHIAGMLHDIVRPVANVDHAEESAEEARKILERLELEERCIERICSAIRQHSMPGKKDSVVAKAVFYADKIGEQFGACGAIRAGIWIGELGEDFEALRVHLHKKVELLTPGMFHPYEKLASRQMETRRRFLKQMDERKGFIKQLIELGKKRVSLEDALTQVERNEYVDETLAYIEDPVGFMKKLLGHPN